jgi:fatty-acyl-CoA synthase
MNGITCLSDVERIERHRPALSASTYELIRQAAALHGGAPALSFFARAQDHDRPLTWDYATLFAKITATANFFHALGIGRDDVIAIVLPNLPQTHLAIWSGQATGMVLAINPMLEPVAIAELLKAGGATVLVTLAFGPESDLWMQLQPLTGRVPGLRHVVLVDPAEFLPGGSALSDPLQSCIRHDPDRIPVHAFAAGIRSQPTDRLVSGRVIAPDDFSSFFCTGGTTGTPKIAMRRHANEVANAWSVGQVLGDGIGPGKTLFCGLPMFHVNAVLVTGLLPFSRGAHVILGTPQGWRGEGVIARFWEMVERHRINFFSGVPTVYASLLQQPIGGRDLGSLEFGLCGAAPMPTALMRSFEATTGLKILEGYGLTEGTCVSTVNPPQGERRAGSIGLRLPLQAMKAVLLDDAGAHVRDCMPGEVGVLVIRGPNVFAGYRVAEHDNGLWIDAGDGDGERWLNTGDLGFQDAEGYFHLTGRKKELIIRGGHNIDPAAIEQPLHEHPAVLMAAAVGRPDAHAGELPVAYVQLRPGAATTAEDLLGFARERIGERAAVPKAIRIVQAMPLTGVGKLFKPELKRRETEEALGDALSGAGVPCVSVQARNDPSAGTVVDVALADGADRQRALDALAPFALRVLLDTSGARR